MIQASNSFGCIVSHELLIRNIYKVTKFHENSFSYSYDPGLFDIKVPFKRKKSKNVKYTSELDIVQKHLNKMSELYQSSVLCNADICGDNSLAKSFAQNFYKNSARHPKLSFNGGNTSPVPCVCKIDEEEYIIPGNCLFYCQDVKDINSHLEGKVFDVILLDPPWWNKYIRRKRKNNSEEGYDMVYDSDLISIPINSLLQDNGIVGVWCTSAKSHINYLLSEIFTSWGLDYLCQWFWMKITKSGEPICGFSEPPGKQPYERIIFGVKKNSIEIPTLEENKMIMSVPSAIHSHKPPLNELLEKYIKKDAICLEIFARYLLPNWTSYGNEVLKLQHISLFSKNKEQVR